MKRLDSFFNTDYGYLNTSKATSACPVHSPSSRDVSYHDVSVTRSLRRAIARLDKSPAIVSGNWLVGGKTR